MERMTRHFLDCDVILSSATSLTRVRRLIIGENFKKEAYAKILGRDVFKNILNCYAVWLTHEYKTKF